MTSYATTAQIKAALHMSPADIVDDSLLAMCGSAATDMIDSYTGRTFGTATATRVYATESNYLVQVDDLAGTALTLKTSSNYDGVYDLTWAATDYQLEPLNGVSDGVAVPYTRIRAIGDNVFPTSAEATVQVTAVFGFATSVPMQVTYACIVQASRLFKRFDSPLGVAGVSDLGIMRVSSKLDPDVAQALSGYVRYRGFA